MSVIARARAAEPFSADSYNRCRAISDDKDRLLCFESLTSPTPQQTPSPVPTGPQSPESLPPGSTSEAQPGSTSTALGGKWRLVRTADPRRGPEGKNVVSIMTTAELSGSDIDFAGLDFRCAEPGFDVMVFLLSPLRLQARPTVTINDQRFAGTVVSPGTAIQLPKEASERAREQWRSLPTLSIQVENEKTTIRGMVSLEGFASSLQTLMETCSTR